MKKPVVNLPASVRQRLLNLAIERKEDFGLVLSRYGLERFLYRLSASPHRDLFVLKGALLLQVWTGETYRPTRDLDLLGKAISNVSYKKIFSDVCSQKVEDDGLSLPSDSSSQSASLAPFSAGAIIIFGGLPMSGMDHSATVEQAEELVQLCRQGRLYQLDKCRNASGVAP